MKNQMKKNPSELSPDPPPDNLGIRCPRLGHQINFSYCRVENSGIPCFKTLDCWHIHFDVQTHLKQQLTSQEFEKAFMVKGKPKVLSLLDLIEQAENRKGKKH